jgi:hypothetical protein
MSYQRWYSIVFTSILLLLTACVRSGRTKVAELDQELRVAVHPGDSAADVARRLDSLDIQHSGYDHIRRVMMAEVEGKPGWKPVYRSLSVTFSFDQNDRLIKHEVRETFTGP